MNTDPVFCARCTAMSYGAIIAGPSNVPHALPDSAFRTSILAMCAGCKEGLLLDLTRGSVYPPGRSFGGKLNHLPTDVENAWADASTCHAVGAYTAAELMCRKILMHVAVDRIAGVNEGERFTYYVDELDKAGYITAGLKDTVSAIRERGNRATHNITASNRVESEQTMKVTQYLLRGVYEFGND